MEKGNYRCALCENEFEPTKRGVQRFCTSKCRKKYHYHLNKKMSPFYLKFKNTEIIEVEKPKNKIEEMSMSGVGNSYFGALAALATTEVAKNIFAPPKPIIKEEINNNQEYLQVRNLPTGPNGSKPFFDVKQQIIIYVPDPNYKKNPADHII